MTPFTLKSNTVYFRVPIPRRISISIAGPGTVEDAAGRVVKAAVLDADGPTGHFFSDDKFARNRKIKNNRLTLKLGHIMGSGCPYPLQRRDQ
jgi:hypothetical protein